MVHHSLRAGVDLFDESAKTGHRNTWIVATKRCDEQKAVGIHCSVLGIEIELCTGSAGSHASIAEHYGFAWSWR